MDHAITLSCPNCGANLNITSDMETFACGYCGSRQIVQRHGGTISLKLLGDAIARVQVGTDRTAAELAVRRLREELASTELELQEFESAVAYTESNAAGCGTVGCLFVLGWFITASLATTNNSALVGIAVLSTIALCIFTAIQISSNRRARRKSAVEGRQDIHARKTMIESELREQLQLLTNHRS